MTSIDERCSSLRERMSRARTPFGAVPISTIYGYEYPLGSKVGPTVETSLTSASKHDFLDSVDYLVRSSRAFSESRALDPYFTSPSLNYMPMALRIARSPSPYRDTTPFEASFERDLSRKPPVAPPRRKVETKRVEAPPTRNTTVTFESTTPWNATGFYYSPRYPQSHRGTASTYNALGRRYFDDIDYYCPYPSIRYNYFRYPVRRFVPSYVPFRYSRRY